MTDDIVRVKVLREGRYRTTVSFDRLLVNYAMMVLETDLAGFGKWLQETLCELEAQWAMRAAEASIGDQIHPDAGLSRLLQRETLKLIVESLQGKGNRSSASTTDFG